MMMKPYRSTSLPVQWPPAHLLPPFAAAVATQYQLVALLLYSDSGQPRPVLGLRRELPVCEELLRQPSLAQKQANLARPFVLRATLGECIETQVTNLLPHTMLELALADDDYNILECESAAAIAPGACRTLTWRCRHAGLYPIYNRACCDPTERRTLLGVLIIEPS